VQRQGGRAIGKAFIVAVPALILPFIIRTAVVEGVATATEVSTIGVVYTVLAGIFIYRQFPLRKLYPILIETAALTGAILLIIGAATAMGWALTQSGFSRQLAQAMTRMPAGFSGGVGGRFRHSGLGARRHSCDRPVRPIAVSHCARGRRA
jgi:TRAP-type C4-dicarboxylate transport system permease large subunit